MDTEPSSSDDLSLEPTHEAIAGRARELWEERNRPEGQDEEIWFAAERELQRRPPVLQSDSDEPMPSATQAAAANESTSGAKSRRTARGGAARV